MADPVEHVYWASANRGEKDYDEEAAKQTVSVMGDGNPLLLTDLWDDDSVKSVTIHGIGTMSREEYDEQVASNA